MRKIIIIGTLLLLMPILLIENPINIENNHFKSNNAPNFSQILQIPQVPSKPQIPHDIKIEINENQHAAETEIITETEKIEEVNKNNNDSLPEKSPSESEPLTPQNTQKQPKTSTQPMTDITDTNLTVIGNQPMRNKDTDNFNVLFIGKEEDRLLMTAVYSINHKNSQSRKFKSGGVFFSGLTKINYNNEVYTLNSFYKKYHNDKIGQKLVKVLEDLLEIEIAYYVLMDKEILKESNKVLDPVIVDDEEVNIEEIFEMPVSNKDQEILGQIAEQFTRTSTYFYSLPSIIIKSARHIETDFSLTPENLWLHFKIARGVDMSNIKKIVLEGNCPDYLIKDIIYRITNEDK